LFTFFLSIDALVLYHAEGEKIIRRPSGVLNDALDNMRNVKRAAAIEVAKLLEHDSAAVVARMEKLETERHRPEAATAPAKAVSTNTSSKTRTRIDVDVEGKRDGVSESSKKACTATVTNNSTTSVMPAATNKPAAAAADSIQLQAAMQNSRFDSDKPATNRGQAPESSKNAIKGTAVPKAIAGANEDAVPKTAKSPPATTAKAATSLKKPKASAAQPSGATKKIAAAAPPKKRQAASVAATKVVKTTSASAATKGVKTASARAAKSPKSASTANSAKRPSPSAVQAPEPVKKPRKASPPQRKTATTAVAAPAAISAAAPPARQKRKCTTAATGPIVPPTRKSLQEQPRSYAKQRVAKVFPDGELYFGYVKYYNAEDKLWRIFYDDDDKEDYDTGEWCALCSLLECC
jgi:hypothetical protein